MSPLIWALFALAALIIILLAVVLIVRGPDAVRALLSPDVRRWLYALAAAVLVLLTGYGILDGHLASLWGLVAAALFGVAHENTPTVAKPLDAPVNSAPVEQIVPSEGQPADVPTEPAPVATAPAADTAPATPAPGGADPTPGA